MRRRNRLAASLVALLAVGTILASTPPRSPARAADPLSAAKQQQAQLHETLSQQRAKLAELKATSATLSQKLDLAKAELAQVTAQYDHVKDLLGQVRDQITEITAQLADLRARIAALDAQLTQIAAEITLQGNELRAREALLQDHLRAAYEQSQTSLLEILISADSLDDAATQVSWTLEMSEQDSQLADEIRDLRAQLQTKQDTLRDGRAQLADARAAAEDQQALLKERQQQLDEMSRELARLQAAADQKRREQEAALNAALAAKGSVEAQIAANEKAAKQADALVSRLQAEAAARAKAIEEAKQRAAAEEAKRREHPPVSARGFRWPEAAPRITQDFGPTSFVLEPSYTYHGTYYPHFHTGLDMASGCNTPIVAAATGVVARSGQPSWPFDSAFGVIIDHGNGVMTWYWHMQPRVIVSPGQAVSAGQVIGYEGSTGNSTGCHLHFAVNFSGSWQNPRAYLP
ncbi:MAG TPA: peptidoglycan DD-metalloendopeptidase family protein [Candidatus Limnocylindria bacterium]|nr:peptidoglycan DD-metalloendopeptidase family protein [Candidatus Limnocylindria bacterium]